MQNAIVVQRPDAAAAHARELLLLFHGVGSSADDLRPLGQALAARRPGAWVVSVRSPHRCDDGAGWQWFSVRGVTEENRPARVAAAMPAFLQTVAAWQRDTGVAAPRTTLAGFSQGAIMALESTQHGAPTAGRVVAIAGRFAQSSRGTPAGALLHLVHGEQDRVMPIGLAVDAEQQVRSLGARAMLDRVPSLGHGIDARFVAAIVRRLGDADVTS